MITCLKKATYKLCRKSHIMLSHNKTTGNYNKAHPGLIINNFFRIISNKISN